MPLSRHTLACLALPALVACPFDPPPLSDDTEGTDTGSTSDADGGESTLGGSSTTVNDSLSEPTTGLDSSSSSGGESGSGSGSEESTAGDTEICGDGVIEGAEACDDDNTVDGDGCSDACQVEMGFVCEGRPSVCTSPCGNGVLDGPERCDDAGMVDGDGCSADCSVELYYRCVGAGTDSCAPIRIAFAPADGDDLMYRAEVQAITGGPVDYVDTGTMTPTLVELETNYDCVMTYANETYQDPILFGNTLGSFVDGGANVVLGIASAFPPAGLIGSTILSVGYSPINSVDLGFDLTATYVGDGTTVIHQGVVSYDTTITDTQVMLQGAGMSDSIYDNGEIASAYRPDFKVVYLNGTGSSIIPATGDWSLLFANACAAGFVQ